MLELILEQMRHSAEVFGIALVNTALASAAITALACCAMRVRGWNASSRYCVWWLILLLLTVLPLVQIVSQPPAAVWQKHPPTSPLTAARPFQPGYPPALASISLPEVGLAHSPTQRVARRFALHPGAGTLLAVCCCLIVLQFCRLVISLSAGLRLKRTAVASTDPRLLVAFSRALAFAKSRRTVLLKTSDSVTSPVMVGYLRPTILIPERLLRQLEPEELRQVLSHELAHVARYDDWAIALQRIAQAVFFFHPFIRFVCWRLDVDREIACDDRVIASVLPASYAACLARIAELTGLGPQLAGTLPLLSRKSNLTARVEMILDRTRSHVPRFSSRRIVCIGAFGFIACVLGAHGPALMAYPQSGSPQIAVPATSVAATSQKERKAVPPAPPNNPAMPKPKSSSPEISAIAVTAEDGSAATFDASGRAEREPASALPSGTIVFRRDGRSYIIRDPSTIAGAEQLIHAPDQLGHAQEQLAQAQEQMSNAQKLLNEQMQKLVVPNLDLKALKQLDELNLQAGERLHSLDTEELEKAGEEQRQKMEAMIGQMGSQLAQQNMGEIQQRLGSIDRLQGGLFEGQMKENRTIQNKLKDLIERAEKQGLAKPLQ